MTTTLEAAGLKTAADKQDSSPSPVKKESSQTHFEFSFIDSGGATIDFMIMATCPKTVGFPKPLTLTLNPKYSLMRLASVRGVHNIQTLKPEA